MRKVAGITVLRLWVSLLAVSATAPASDKSSNSASCAPLLPAAVNAQLAVEYKGWKLVEYEELSADDRQLWGRKCPGVAVGDFEGRGIKSYAVILVRQVEGTKQAKLVLVEQSDTAVRTRILREDSRLPSYPVVHTGAPNTYHFFYDEKQTVRTTHEVIIYERIEATATVFYYQDGMYKQLLISD